MHDLEEYRRIFTDNRGLAELIWRFNFDLLGYAHPSWIASLLSPELATALGACPRTRGRLNASLLAGLPQVGEPCFRFASPLARLALVPPEVLVQTAFLLGIGLYAPLIKLVIGSAEVAAIKSGLGEAAYTFALRRFGLLSGAVEAPSSSLPLPETLARQARAQGMRILLALLGGAAPRAIGRARLKFPQAIETTEEPLPAYVTGERGAALTLKIVTCEVAPAWAHLFS